MQVVSGRRGVGEGALRAADAQRALFPQCCTAILVLPCLTMSHRKLICMQAVSDQIRHRQAAMQRARDTSGAVLRLRDAMIPYQFPMQVVSDQIRLWQADTQRVRAIPAVLYTDFETPGLWAGTAAKAKELGSQLWEAPPRLAGESF